MVIQEHGETDRQKNRLDQLRLKEESGLKQITLCEGGCWGGGQRRLDNQSPTCQSTSEQQMFEMKETGSDIVWVGLGMSS